MIVDPDIAAVLRTFEVAREGKRVRKVRERQLSNVADKVETWIELFADQLEEFIPRTDPRFLPALSAVIVRKLAQQFQTEEESSPLAEGFDL